MLKISYAGCIGRNSLLKCAPQPKIANNQLIHHFGSSRSFKVIDVCTPEKFVSSKSVPATVFTLADSIAVKLFRDELISYCCRPTLIAKVVGPLLSRVT